MTPALIISIIGIAITIGGICIAIGVLKGKINQNAEQNKLQEEQAKTFASKDDLAMAIKRSDEMLDIMRKRAEEDREKGQGQWREFHSLLADHTGRIKVLENQQNTLKETLDEIKGDIKSGFKQIQDDLKEMRKENNNG